MDGEKLVVAPEGGPGTKDAGQLAAQIRPHFLLNALNTVYYLIGRDDAAAKEAVLDLGQYLRDSLTAMDSVEPIPLWRELELVRAYLRLEQRRYGGKIRVEYDLRETDFPVPVMAVQMLAENAVKHGLFRNPEGGRIVIASGRDDGGFYVSVTDDGPGYDHPAPGADDRRHIGLENIRLRLEDMFPEGAGLELERCPDCGTRAVIRIREIKQNL